MAGNFAEDRMQIKMISRGNVSEWETMQGRALVRGGCGEPRMAWSRRCTGGIPPGQSVCWGKKAALARLTMTSPTGVYYSNAALLRLTCLKSRRLLPGVACPVHVGLCAISIIILSRLWTSVFHWRHFLEKNNPII